VVKPRIDPLETHKEETASPIFFKPLGGRGVTEGRDRSESPPKEKKEVNPTFSSRWGERGGESFRVATGPNGRGLIYQLLCMVMPRKGDPVVSRFKEKKTVSKCWVAGKI